MTLKFDNMFVHTLTVLLSLAGAVTPFPTTVKRADVVETQLYAYGTGISGLQIYGGTDGKMNRPNHLVILQVH